MRPSDRARELWSDGRPEEALGALADLHPTTYDVEVDRSAALALHDLERNLRVADHASRCVDAYRADGRVEAQLIANVQLGDALWGAGQVRNARIELQRAYDAARHAVLPAALDVAALSLANVLAVTGEPERARQLNGEGVELAVRIGNHRDELFGRIYGLLLDAERGEPVDHARLFELADRAAGARYRYLESLALAFAVVVATLDGEGAGRRALDAVSRRAGQELHNGPAAHLTAMSVLLANDADPSVDRAFLRVLGRCEGLRGRPAYALRALECLRDGGRLDPVQAQFASRWNGRFGAEFGGAQPDHNAALMLECDYRGCEGRCCYNGVYLKPGDAERITEAIALDNDLAARLPAEWIVVGVWEGVSELKTAVVSHTYSSPDFPAHYDQTKCVFGEADGACGLEALARRRGEHKWRYKPRSCCIHPLRVRDDQPIAPADPLARDEQNVGVMYPGYVPYSPCGQQRRDGRPWQDVLSEEIVFQSSPRQNGDSASPV